MDAGMIGTVSSATLKDAVTSANHAVAKGADDGSFRESMRVAEVSGAPGRALVGAAVPAPVVAAVPAPVGAAVPALVGAAVPALVGAAVPAPVVAAVPAPVAAAVAPKLTSAAPLPIQAQGNTAAIATPQAVPPKAQPSVPRPERRTAPTDAVSVHEEAPKRATAQASQDAVNAVVAKKSSHQDGAVASETKALPAAAETGVAVAQPDQPVPAVTPVTVTPPKIDPTTDVVLPDAPVQVAETGKVSAAALSDPTASAPVKAVGRDAKKVDGPTAHAVSDANAGTVTVPVANVAAPAENVTLAAKEMQLGATVAPIVQHDSHISGPTADGLVTASTHASGSSAHAAAQAGTGSDLQTLVATPNVLEVGIATGTHGWLRVRAELGDTGDVTASMAATSQSVVDGLHKELPALSAYLTSEHVTVSSLVVNALDQAAGAQNAATRQGDGGSGQAAAGASADGQPGQEARSARAQNDVAARASAEPDAGVDFNPGMMPLPVAVYANGSGSWLSVRV